MRRWVVSVLATLLAVSTALPASPRQRVKRAEETVMYGNQQNYNHQSVKKSGPAPLDSKLAEKQAAVQESHDKAADAAETELNLMNAEEPENALHTLASHGDAEADGPLIAEERKEKAPVSRADKPKRDGENARQQVSDERLLSFINKYGPETFTLEAGRGLSRQKRVVDNSLAPSRLQRLRRDLTRVSSEAHMAASSQRRKKRDVDLDMDPDQLARLQYYLSRDDDGYDVPQEVMEPAYEEDGDDEEEMPTRERRGMMDDYSRYAVAKRLPDEDEEAPVEVEEAAEQQDPVSVYESEFGPVTYGLIEHEGVPGLFVPLEQPSMRRLLEAEEDERDSERARLKTLATILSLNNEKEERRK